MGREVAPSVGWMKGTLVKSADQHRTYSGQDFGQELTSQSDNQTMVAVSGWLRGGKVKRLRVVGNRIGYDSIILRLSYAKMANCRRRPFRPGSIEERGRNANHGLLLDLTQLIDQWADRAGGSDGGECDGTVGVAPMP